MLSVVASVLIDEFFHQGVKKVEPLLPVLAIVIGFLIAITVALNQQKLDTVGGMGLPAVVLHNVTGLCSGYGIARISALNTVQCRTIAIEVGMQNAGLGVALAVKYFSPVAVLPGAIFSVWHNIAGAILAGYWRNNRQEDINHES